MMSTFTHKDYRIEAESRKDTSARLGQAYFMVYKPDGAVAFYLDFEVSRFAAAHFWGGHDEEQIALREGERKV